MGQASPGRNQRRHGGDVTGGFSDPEVRIEGRDKVTGAAAYAADFHHVDALDVAFVRSPFPLCPHCLDRHRRCQFDAGRTCDCDGR